MSRGRKPNSGSTGLDSEQIFDKSLGFYFQYIISRLGTKDKSLSKESANDLRMEIEQERKRLVAEKRIRPDRVFSEPNAEEIPFRLPRNWIWCRLGEIGHWASGSGFPTNYQGQKDKPILFSKVSDMNLPENGRFLNRTENTVDEETAKKIRATPHRAGTVIFPKIGGAIATNKRRILTRPTAIDNNCLGITPSSFCYPLWLYYLLSSIDFAKYQAGTSIPALNQGVIEKIPVAVPPLQDQKIILDFLEDFNGTDLDQDKEYFDSEIENEVVSIHQAQVYKNQISTELDHQLALVKELRQAYLREAMQGKLVPQDPTAEPAESLLEKIMTEKEKLVAEKRIKRDKPLPPINPEELPSEIPSNWTWCRLGDLHSQLLGGFAFESTRYAKDSNNQVIRLGNVKNDKLVLEASPVFIDDQYAEQVLNAELQSGDILITMTGTRAKRDYLFTVLISDKDFDGKRLFLNQRVGCFRLTNRISNKFLNIALKDTRLLDPVFDSATGAANQANIGVTALKNVLIPLPPLVEQERIVAKLEKLLKFCDELESNIKQGIINAERLLQTALKEALEPKDKKAIDV